MNYILRYCVLLILAVIKFLLPFLLQHSVYEMDRDEFLYVEQGHHLAWGFLEVPPLLSILASLTHLPGGNFFWVKFWPSLFGAINVFIAGRIAEEMGGKAFAQFLAGLCVITGAYLRVNFLFQPVFLEIFFWTLSAYYVARYVNTQHIRYVFYWR